MTAPVRLRIWPLRAVRDAKQPPARGGDEVLALVNCYAEEREIGPLIVTRPGFAKIATQLGAGANRRGQLVTQFTKRNGTTYTVLICGGKFYTYDWGADTVTEVLDSTDFSGASITLSAAAKCYAATFADKLIVSDGVNVPWAWDGTSHGGLTKCTNAPVIYGPIVVYYAKWVGIKNTARSTIVWSEEGEVNVGFEAGGYNNAWDLVQTRTEGLTSLAASNDALYYARQNSVGAITGAVSTDFRSTGVREAVSDTSGTLAADGFIVVDNRLIYVDQYGRFQVGGLGGVREVGTGAATLMSTIPTNNLANVSALDDPETGHVRFAIPESGSDDPTMQVWLSRDDGRFASQCRGYQFSRWGSVQDGTKQPTIVHIGGANATTSASGYAYKHGHPRNGSIWSDGFANGTAAIETTLETGHAGAGTLVDKVFTRGEIALLLPTRLSGLSLTHITSQTTSAALTFATLSTGGTPLGMFVLGTDTLGGSTGETKRTWTTRQRGRWCKLRFNHGVAGERIAVSELALEYTPVSRRAGVR